MRRLTMTAALLAIAAAAVPAIPAYAAPMPGAQAWEIGPIIRGRNYSVGMPLHPTPARRGWYFDFPYPAPQAGHVHYLTFPHGPLTGKSRIVMRYRIDAAPGVRFVPVQNPDLPATISLFFQRQGDSWSTRRGHEAYRWYAPYTAMAPVTPGEHQIVIDLRDKWISVNGREAQTNPAGFDAAIRQTERVGFVLGSGGGRGHGVYATGPARLTVTSFEVL